MQPSASQLVRKQLIASSADRTRERLLDAATETLNRVGIQGATTREIAWRAGVNEVTLFRHFKSKEQLLRAVLQRGLAAEAAILDEHSSWKENLRESLEKYARQYQSLLHKNKDFAGVFLAERHLWPKSMQAMIADVIRPQRERLVSILADAQKAGVIRSDLNIECALDAFKNVGSRTGARISVGSTSICCVISRSRSSRCWELRFHAQRFRRRSIYRHHWSALYARMLLQRAYLPRN